MQQNRQQCVQNGAEAGSYAKRLQAGSPRARVYNEGRRQFR
ncbi:MAG TPA: hypothetical protein VF899_22050 [Pyrinomonadaceae bacterium]